jgi:predicted ribosome quality control (RQC) complex YloA/Tae2 family protein
MDNFYLSGLVQELASQVAGRSVAKVSVASSTLLFDLRLGGERRLLVSLDRASPALYLSATSPSQRLKEKPTETGFLSLLRKHIADARLIRVSKQPSDRVVHLDFEKRDAGDSTVQSKLVLMLTGRSTNASLVDGQGQVLAEFFQQEGTREPSSSNLTAGTLSLASLTSDLRDSMTQSEVLDRFWGNTSVFGPQLRNEFIARCGKTSPAESFKSLVEDLFNREPLPLLYSRLPLEQIGQRVISPKTDLLLSHIELTQSRKMRRYQFASLSEAADEYYSARRRATDLRDEHSALKQELTREIARRETAIKAIESDRARFENPERLKRFGDLILANLANARITGTKVTVVDYYDADQTEIQIDIPEGVKLQEAASDYFSRYRKARRALEAIAKREDDVARNLDPLKELLLRLEQEPIRSCVDEVRKAADQILGRPARARRQNRNPSRKSEVFGRRFRSSDGYEIVVGRNDNENDALTFRVARPHDLWLHAADYPGSHVVVRNPTRELAPHRTITEAAELAAFYSQAKREGKAAVHYTQKKYVSKPPRSKPGLVRLSSFKTILVEPRCTPQRID